MVYCSSGIVAPSRIYWSSRNAAGTRCHRLYCASSQQTKCYADLNFLPPAGQSSSTYRSVFCMSSSASCTADSASIFNCCNLAISSLADCSSLIASCIFTFMKAKLTLSICNGQRAVTLIVLFKSKRKWIIDHIRYSSSIQVHYFLVAPHPSSSGAPRQPSSAIEYGVMNNREVAANGVMGPCVFRNRPDEPQQCSYRKEKDRKSL